MCVIRYSSLLFIQIIWLKKKKKSHLLQSPKNKTTFIKAHIQSNDDQIQHFSSFVLNERQLEKKTDISWGLQAQVAQKRCIASVITLKSSFT